MDIKELQSHAKRHRDWFIQITKSDTLICKYRLGTNSEGATWDDFSYYLNFQRITSGHASSILERLFAEAIGLQLVEKVA